MQSSTPFLAYQSSSPETKCQVLQNLCLSATLIIAEEKTLSIPEYCNQRQTQQIPFQGATQLSGKA